jgi:hypothetical protein
MSEPIFDGLVECGESRLPITFCGGSLQVSATRSQIFELFGDRLVEFKKRSFPDGIRLHMDENGNLAFDLDLELLRENGVDEETIKKALEQEQTNA